jgi:hypothetical protein
LSKFLLGQFIDNDLVYDTILNQYQAIFYIFNALMNVLSDCISLYAVASLPGAASRTFYLMLKTREGGRERILAPVSFGLTI